MITLYPILKIAEIIQIVLMIFSIVVYVLLETVYKNQEVSQKMRVRLLTTSPILINTLKITLVVLPISLGLLIFSLRYYENVNPDLLIVNAVLLYINTIVLLITRIRLYKKLLVKTATP
jgi:hypothetical protein